MPIPIRPKTRKELEARRTLLMLRQQQAKQRKETPLPKLTPAQKKQIERLGLKDKEDREREQKYKEKHGLTEKHRILRRALNPERTREEQKEYEKLTPLQQRKVKDERREKWELKRKIDEGGGWVKKQTFKYKPMA